MKKLLFFVAAMCMFIPTTFALPESCSSSEYTNLVEEIKKVEMSYSYDLYNGYTITLSNMGSNIYATDIFGLRYEADSNGIVSVNPYLVDKYYISALSRYTLTFYAKDSTNCANEPLDLVESIVPKYNEFSTTDTCLENPDDSYCAELIDFNLTESQFEKKFNQNTNVENENNEIINSNNEDKEENNEKSNSSIYFIVGIVIIVIIIILIITFKLYNNKKNKNQTKKYNDIRRGAYTSEKIEDLINEDND